VEVTLIIQQQGTPKQVFIVYFVILILMVVKYKVVVSVTKCYICICAVCMLLFIDNIARMYVGIEGESSCK
jgi:hypothetical protein